MNKRILVRMGATVVTALGLTLTAGAGTSGAAAKPNTVDYFYAGGKKVAGVVFEPRDSAKDAERVDVDDLRADNHYIWTEVYDVTAEKKKGTCQTSTFKSCAFSIPEGHKVRINVYRMNSKDVEFLDEVHTKSGKLPTA
ncbi:hypothetical protein [Streptomyces laculatispora]|uniref:hypothetical protein n=1 Tax=Streptomyces laculatispora TaxID=887464 RepID=UPI001A94C899|nr:hypothetical protein [Streptomyces laculatispora]MBO0918339.1 hypothetical protein [Streptomyces laculatispora]